MLHFLVSLVEPKENSKVYYLTSKVFLAESASYEMKTISLPAAATTQYKGVNKSRV